MAVNTVEYVAEREGNGEEAEEEEKGVEGKAVSHWTQR